MAYTSAFAVVIGAATKKTDVDSISTNADYLQTLDNVEHNFHVSTGTGKHKAINALDVSVGGATVRDMVVLEQDPASGSPTVGQGVALSFKLSDSANNQDEVASIDVVQTDVTSGSEDARFDFRLIVAGTVATKLQLDLASLNPAASDGLGLGTSALPFSDLFLASGAVINFADGDVTITHFADTLTIAGIATLLDIAAGIVEVNNAIRFDTGVAMVAGSYSVGRDADATNQLHFNVPTGASMEWSINDVSKVVMDSSGMVLIGDTSNAFMTQGLTINQGAADNEILAFKSSDIAHGVTDRAETDTYAFMRKYSATAGGLDVWGFSETGTGIWLTGIETTEQLSSSIGSTAYGAINMDTGLKSLTDKAAHSANGLLFTVTSVGLLKFAVDQEGDLFVDGSTSLTAFDDHSDYKVARAIRAGLSPEAFPHAQELARTHADLLEKMNIVHFNRHRDNPSERVPFINLKNLALFSLDMGYQIGKAVYEEIIPTMNRIQSALAKLEAHTGLKLLEV